MKNGLEIFERQARICKAFAHPGRLQILDLLNAVTTVAPVHDDIAVSMDKAAIKIEPRQETKRALSQWGTARTLVSNLINGVTKGFEERLEINGVGYRAAVQGKQLNLQLGYSHDINYPIPQGIAIATPKPTEIVITGVDKQQVGQVAAEVRAYRPPEPYKGKGVRYADEVVVIKETKKK